MSERAIAATDLAAMLPVARAMNRLGLDAGDLFSRHLLPTDTSCDSIIPTSAIYDLMEASAKEIADPKFGSRLAQSMIEDTVDFWAIPIEVDTNLSQVIIHFLLAQKINYTSAPYKLSVGQDRAEIVKIREGTKPTSTVQTDAWELTILVLLLKSRVGKLWNADAVSASVPDAASILECILPRSALVRSQHSGLSISFPTEWMLACPDAQLDEPAAIRPALPSEFIPLVRAIIKPRIANQPPSIEEASHYCGLSVRRLQEMLRAGGTSYRDLVADLRREYAQESILNGTLTLSEISDSLGYSDYSAFSRAFKGWTGLSPESFKDAQD